MHPRLRSFIGSVAILVFLVGYVWAATAIADRLPDDPVIKLVYFAVAGLAWGLPLLPLMTWMNRGR
ncbi:DUF2842 domain-containing protein [Phenylobacterium sp.]|uniref:DUF2842 domain-containing protein n=1 Tax=Phenylobacterium sp. TaxID=1871053 RepID=UPI0025D7E73D|nr:DUF2842 domain-containing protein [Phenylobacterium sp.]MCA6286593.1 DUF2842 domain-containing protein [Phenylobacterium sp.]MCA6309795.1 DUF2842 domain-containing protein [Phenylobacterium sp.]MCA6322722.1 DUF2842 domain-containing protein [Phenylobacterium sp.]MCA6336095.1 DUF2842 domain-containing protein [Phenylobacterium sp.]MCA6338840.1 DUF2842 domain-containing protein [Phenylobacterium sp.]